MRVIYKPGINHYCMDEHNSKTGRKGIFCSTTISSGESSSEYTFKHVYKPTLSEEISTPIAFQPLLQPDNCMCFFGDLWRFISNCSHCFILLNGFSSLPWLNLILALCEIANGHLQISYCICSLLKSTSLQYLMQCSESPILQPRIGEMLLLWNLLAA